MTAESINREIPPQQSKTVDRSDGEGFVLTSDEFQIIALITSGYTNREIACQLCFSEGEIHKRTVRIFEKLGVANELELVLFALSHRVLNEFPADRN